MSEDLGAALAYQWNRIRGGETATAEDFTPILRELAEAGLVEGNEEALTTLQLGPFRIAATPYENATSDFVDVLIPSVIVGLADGTPLHGAVAGALAASTQCFISLLRRGVVFGRSPDDRLRWAILIDIKENRLTKDEAIRRQSNGRAEAALTWLLEKSLVKERPDRTLESLA
jgi:hypothetical protein